ncbi:hypothetical protein Poly30_12410 [Planctomycetes bacterium Poly30]|uniref:DUF3592 domain-containing protein n=1 Tax=Saltatorellus ferox TaxID=2528018 RepID=A0A518ENS4_9BACT|nr:hypothetical protein Poly30_12410 [Planctomycetes bacterium Poly30]
MLKLKSPADVAATAFALALGLLAFGQLKAAAAFTADAVVTSATVIDLRTDKRALLEGQADTFARVQFTPGGPESMKVEAELPTPIRTLGLTEETAVGQTVPIRYDPKNPTNARYGEDQGKTGAFVLLALAIGALFIPTILRRSTLARLAGGGGGG